MAAPLCSQHGGWKHHSPVNSPSKETDITAASFFVGRKRTNCLTKSSVISLLLNFFRVLFWVCIRGTLSVNHPDTSLTRTPSFPVRSCTFNSTECCETCIPASATAPFHQLASWPFNPIPCSFFSESAISLFLSFTFALESQTNAAGGLWSEQKLILTSLCGSPGLWVKISGCVVMLP